MTDKTAFATLPISRILPGENVRLELDGIDALADSLKQHGMLQPITVVPTEADGDKVEVLFGHRRFAAAKKIGMAEVPCFLRGRGNETQRLLTQLAENFDREDMTPLDEALAFRDLVEQGMTQLQIAARVHRSDFYVSTRMSVLKYPECVQLAVHTGRIGVASALSIPLDLLANEKNVESLGRVLEYCEVGKVGPLKDWITERMRVENRTVFKKHRRRRYLEVDLDTYELASKAAHAAGKTLWDWTADMVKAAATA